MCLRGDVAEWLRSGLQSRLHRFDSGRRLSRGIRTAVVFGGNSEIAQATLAALADDGLEQVVLAVRDPARAGGADELRARGLAVDVVPFDADAPATHEAAVDASFAAAQPRDVDLAIVAFAVLGDQDRAKRDHEAAVRLAQTNFVGAVSVLTLLGERLRRQGHGTIVVLSSVAGERARRANYPYGATKAGLDAFAQGLGDALAEANVHVLVARPGWVRTKMTAGRPPAPLPTTPERVADDIVAGLRRGAHTVWSPRVLRAAFALMRALPRPLWRRLRD
jgi:decaprenylphospho-beta-D-erythro-pentofuranosid-2-ulose 2-reductase